MATKEYTFIDTDFKRPSVEDAVRLYNLDIYDEIALREMRIELNEDGGDYNYNYSQGEELDDFDDYQRLISTELGECSFIHWVEQFRELMDRAIKGGKPTDKDLSILNQHLINGRGELISPEELRDSTGRYGIIEWHEDPYYSYYNGILQIWNGEVEVKRCKASGCNKIFPADGRRKYCPNVCSKREGKKRDRNRKREDMEPHYQERAQLIAEWITQECLWDTDDSHNRREA